MKHKAKDSVYIGTRLNRIIVGLSKVAVIILILSYPWPAFGSSLTTYGVYWPGIRDFLEEIAIPQFKSRSGHTINIVSDESSAQTLEKVREDSERGSGRADFVWMNLSDLDSYLKDDLLMDLADLVEPLKDQLPPAYLKAVSTQDGKIVAVPHHLSAHLMVYNQEAIPRVGLPDTYSELLLWSEINEGRYSYGGEDEFLTTGLIGVFLRLGSFGRGSRGGQTLRSRREPQDR